MRREFVRAPDQSPELAGTVLRLRLVGGFVALLVIAGFAFFPGVSPVERRLFLILGVSLFQPGVKVAESWLQSRLQSGRSVVLQWIAIGAGAGARVVAIVFKAPVEVFAEIVVLETVLSAGLVLIGARRSGFRFGLFDSALARRLLRECWPLGLASVAMMIYMRIDILMLRWMVGAESAGVYAAAVRLSELGYFLPVVVAASVQPAMVRAYAGSKAGYYQFLQRYFDASALAAYALSVPITLLAPWIVRVAYGSQYAAASSVLVIHTWASIFVFLGVARGPFLINGGFTRFSLASTLAGALANVVLNLLLIPHWAAVGAAVATVGSYGIWAWLTSLLSSQVRPAGWQLTRALLLPFTGWRYLCRT